MDYLLAFATLIVVLILPAAIVAGLVGAPERRHNAGDAPPPDSRNP